MMLPAARINLLPYRERRVKELRVHFFTITGIVMVVSILVVLGFNFFLGTFVEAQNLRVEALKIKIAEQDKEIEVIATLKKQIEALIGRKSVIEDLQDNKNSPIRLLNSVSIALPPQGLYLESFVQAGATITLSAIADGNVRISNFISNLENSKGVFRNVRLGNSTQFDYGTQKFFRFNLTFDCSLFQR